MARVHVAERVIRATFTHLTGPLRITEGARVWANGAPIRFWLAIASVSRSNGWGTRHSEADLAAVLKGYLATKLPGRDS